MEDFNDILGFDPTQLSVFNQEERKASFSNNIYKPKPADSISDDGIYRSVIKVVYNPYNLKRSVLERQSYWLTDANGGFEVISSLTNNDTNCPVFKAWKTCHYSKDAILKNQAESVANGGKGLFDKRYARYVLIQVLEDENKPDLVGQFMFWKCPKFIWDMIENRMKPTDSKKAPLPVMDYLFGRAIELEVTPGPGKPGEERYSRETSYNASSLSEDPMPCVNPDGSSLLTPEQQEVLDEYIDAVKKVWKEKDPDKRLALQTEVNGMKCTAALRGFYNSIVEKIKDFAPDMFAELGFKEWSPEVTARVNAWIDVVLSGNDPASVVPSVVSTAAAPAATQTASPSTSVSVAAESAESDDDLPF